MRRRIWRREFLAIHTACMLACLAFQIFRKEHGTWLLRCSMHPHLSTCASSHLEQQVQQLLWILQLKLWACTYFISTQFPQALCVAGLSSHSYQWLPDVLHILSQFVCNPNFILKQYFAMLWWSVTRRVCRCYLMLTEEDHSGIPPKATLLRFVTPEYSGAGNTEASVP